MSPAALTIASLFFKHLSHFLHHIFLLSCLCCSQIFLRYFSFPLNFSLLSLVLLELWYVTQSLLSSQFFILPLSSTSLFSPLSWIILIVARKLTETWLLQGNALYWRLRCPQPDFSDLLFFIFLLIYFLFYCNSLTTVCALLKSEAFPLTSFFRTITHETTQDVFHSLTRQNVTSSLLALQAPHAYLWRSLT